MVFRIVNDEALETASRAYYAWRTCPDEHGKRQGPQNSSQPSCDMPAYVRLRNANRHHRPE